MRDPIDQRPSSRRRLAFFGVGVVAPDETVRTAGEPDHESDEERADEQDGGEQNGSAGDEDVARGYGSQHAQNEQTV